MHDGLESNGPSSRARKASGGARAVFFRERRRRTRTTPTLLPIVTARNASAVLFCSIEPCVLSRQSIKPDGTQCATPREHKRRHNVIAPRSPVRSARAKTKLLPFPARARPPDATTGLSARGRDGLCRPARDGLVNFAARIYSVKFRPVFRSPNVFTEHEINHFQAPVVRAWFGHGSNRV